MKEPTSSESSQSDLPKKEIGDWVQVQAASHYDPMRYLTPQRMAMIGYQFRFLHEYFPKGDVLEVGLGTGLAAHILGQLQHRVFTLDVDEDLSPDIFGSVTEIPCSDEQFESFMCCQVLEHLEWSIVPDALKELSRVTKRGGVISLPTNQPAFGITLQNRKRRTVYKQFTLPKFVKQRIQWPSEHHWELEANVSTKEFREQIELAGMKIIHEIQPMFYFYHHFFVVEKII